MTRPPTGTFAVRWTAFTITTLILGLSISFALFGSGGEARIVNLIRHLLSIVLAWSTAPFICFANRITFSGDSSPKQGFPLILIPGISLFFFGLFEMLHFPSLAFPFQYANAVAFPTWTEVAGNLMVCAGLLCFFLAAGRSVRPGPIYALLSVAALFSLSTIAIAASVPLPPAIALQGGVAVETVILILLVIALVPRRAESPDLDEIAFGWMRAAVFVAILGNAAWIVDAVAPERLWPGALEQAAELCDLALIWLALFRVGIMRPYLRLSGELAETRSALSEAKAEWSVILDLHPALLVIQDTENRILWVNRAGCESAGMARDRLIGRRCFEVWPGFYESCRGCPVVKCRETGEPESGVVRTPDGRAWRIYASPIRDDGRTVTRILEVTEEITETLKTEESLKQSEKRYRNLFERLPICIYKATLDGKILDANPACVDLAAYPDIDAFRAQDTRESYADPEDGRRFREILLKDGYVNGFEARFIRKGGGEKWLSNFARLQTDERGKPLHIEGCFIDITERKKVQDALAESERRFRFIAENTSDGIIVIENDIIVYASPAYLTILGYTASNEIGRTREEIVELIHPDDRERVLGRIMDAIAAGRTEVIYEYRARSRNGVYVWREDHARFIYKRNGGTDVSYEKAVVVCRNVTERKRNEAALARINRLFRGMLENSPLLMMVLDVEGRYRMVCDKLGEFFGMAPDDVVGRRLGELLPEEQAALFLSRIRKVLSDGVPLTVTDELTAGDRTIIYRTIIFPIPEAGEDGSIIGAIAQDVTREVTAERAMNYHARFQRILLEISSSFVSIPGDEADGVILSALATIGSFTDADRAYLFRFRPDGATMDNTHEWCADGVASQKENLQAIAFSDAPWWIDRLRRFETIHVPDISLLPDEAGRERELLQSQSIRSVLALPMRYRETVIGFVGFDAVRKPRQWSPEERALLQIVGETFTNMIVRGRAEAALRESEARYRSIFLNAPIGMVQVAPDGRSLVSNRVFQRMVGYSDMELSAMRISDIIHPRDAAVSWERFQALLSGRIEGYELEKRYVHKDGGTVWGDAKVTAIRNRSGDILTLIVMIQDITQRKEAERALAESEQRFRNLVEHSPSGVWIVVDEMVIYLNPRQKTIFNTTAERLPLRELRIHPDDRNGFESCIRGCRETGNVCHENTFRFYPFGREPSPTNVAWLQCMGAPIRFEGRPAVLINSADITASKRTEAWMRAHERMVSLGYVTAGIAHEIRNPLSGINVLIQGIREQLEADPEQNELAIEMIDEAVKANRKIAEVVRRVLDFSRPGAPQYRRQSLNTVVREAIRMAETTVSKAGVRLASDLSPEIGESFIDARLIEILVLNLINNAVTALADAPERWIRIRTRQAEESLFLIVSDSGPGVPLESREAVFEPFYTTRVSGTGIGLSICRRIAHDHGGTVTVETSDLGGAEMVVTLPILKELPDR